MALGLLLSWCMLLIRETRKRAPEYLWLAFVKKPHHMLPPMVTEWLVASAAVVFLVRPLDLGATPSFLVCAASGVLAVLAPESVALLLKVVLSEHLAKVVPDALFRAFNLSFVRNFRYAVRTLRKDDCLDYRSGDRFWKDFKQLGEPERRHRLRIVFEENKIDIANEWKDPRRLRRDVGYGAYQNFYLVLDYLGRRKLRAFLLDPPEPRREGWSGREDRKVNGSPADRKTDDARTYSRVRSYDRPEVEEAVSQGSASDDFSEDLLNR